MKNLNRFAPLLALLAIAVYFGLPQRPAAVQAPQAHSAPQAVLAPEAAAHTPRSKLPQVQRKNLPSEAQTTLRLIEQGGPFPYSRDGVTFQNRERRLPLKSDGHYREYTVRTPGASDRGARRIIHGAPNEYYYTPDHYRSFQEVAP